MAFRSYREGSKDNWGQEGGLCVEQIQLGAILRIADAAEIMAQSHKELIEERDNYLRLFKEKQATVQGLRGTIRGLRSYISILKKGLDK